MPDYSTHFLRASSAIPTIPGEAPPSLASTSLVPEDSGGSTIAACRVAVQPAGHASPLQVEVSCAEDPSAVNVAKQQAALGMLHQLQALVLGMLRPAPLGPNSMPGSAGRSPIADLPSNVGHTLLHAVHCSSRCC